MPRARGGFQTQIYLYLFFFIFFFFFFFFSKFRTQACSNVTAETTLGLSRFGFCIKRRNFVKGRERMTRRMRPVWPPLGLAGLVPGWERTESPAGASAGAFEKLICNSLHSRR